jgi:Mlc titration factor MtfA (ptsG expression regulator)
MEGDDDIYSSAQMVEFGVYESLRRKYDALQEEREELLNETFALMDASAAANAAELDAITRRVENKADLRLIECRQEADARIQFYDDRLASCTCSS